VELSKLEREKAIERRKNEVTACPKCGSKDYIIDDAEPATVTSPDTWNFDMHCAACGKTWCEVWVY